MLTANNFLISHAPLNFARIFNSSLEKKWRQMMFRYDSIVSHRFFLLYAFIFNIILF